MTDEKVLGVCRTIFYLSTGALCAGFVLVLPLLLGGDGWLVSATVTEKVGGSLMGVGAVTGGMSGLLLLTA